MMLPAGLLLDEGEGGISFETPEFEVMPEVPLSPPFTPSALSSLPFRHASYKGIFNCLVPNSQLVSITQ
jgi:hypothetical protein